MSINHRYLIIIFSFIAAVTIRIPNGDLICQNPAVQIHKILNVLYWSIHIKLVVRMPLMKLLERAHLHLERLPFRLPLLK